MKEQNKEKKTKEKKKKIYRCISTDAKKIIMHLLQMFYPIKIKTAFGLDISIVRDCPEFLVRGG